MAKSKLIVKHPTYTDVVFLGYTVTSKDEVTHTFNKFTMRYPVTGVPDWILMDASAHRWIAEQSPLRDSPAKIRSLEGAVLDPHKSLASQLVITPETAFEVATSAASVDDLEAMQAKIEAMLAAKKAATETPSN